MNRWRDRRCGSELKRQSKQEKEEEIDNKWRYTHVPMRVCVCETAVKW